jgi:SAM-dependent methyltransferase
MSGTAGEYAMQNNERGFDLLHEKPGSPSDEPPPREIPENLYNAFTMNGEIAVVSWYFDERAHGSDGVYITRLDYERAFKELEARVFKYYGNEVHAFYDALDDYSVSGKRVLIFGLTSCNCDAMALWKGAAEVYVVDYNRPFCAHDAVHTVTHDELKNLNIQFDFAISFSSFEHDGLGRYGDPIHPDGDLLAMRKAEQYLKADGILFLGVPLGPDCLCWNAHRIYGPVRLPLLLRGWLPLDVYSAYPSVFDCPLGVVRQPLLVLKKCVSNGEEYAERLMHRYKSNLICEHCKGWGTKDVKMLGQILEYMLRDLKIQPMP